MERGNVVVNGKPVASPQHIVKNGDVISHTLHRHEPPVTALPIAVLHEDEDMIVINKPAGVPVHPAGRYNFNSVVEIMRAERAAAVGGSSSTITNTTTTTTTTSGGGSNGTGGSKGGGPGGWNPLPCNRLDRLTSGVMFIGKHARAAERLSAQIMGRTVRKEYVARVKGEFPEGDVVCDMPILQISPKLGLNRVRASGKASRTVFKRLAYYPPPPATTATGTPAAAAAAAAAVSAGAESDEPGPVPVPVPFDSSRPWLGKSGYSVVRCLPITGRTHQIRVHLQFLGHPIANDPIYSNQRVWGQRLGAGDADALRDSDEDVITRLSRMGKEEVADAVSYHDEMVDEYNRKKAEKMSGERCAVCDTPLYTDPGAHELGIYLHALRYEDVGGGWSYKSPLPAWAMPPRGERGPTEVGGMEELLRADESDLQEKDVEAAGAEPEKLSEG